MIFLLYRYAEDAGAAARFNIIRALAFLSSTELICADRNNHCIRHVDLSLSPPETSTFAGSCTTSGNADGHRVNSARFRFPKYTEVNNHHFSLLILDYFDTLRMIDLKTDIVTTLVTFDSYCNDIKLLGENLLYVTQSTRVIVFNSDTREESVVAGGESRGSANGPFNHTRFQYARGLMLRTDAINKHLLVADCNNDR